MAEIGIFDSEQKKWIQFDEDTEVQIRFLSREEITKIRKKAQKAARLSGSEADEISNRLIGEAAVFGWRNIDNHDKPGLSINKQPLPFSDDNRNMLMKKSLEFSNFVNETAVNSRLFLEEDAAAAEEREVIKNDL